MHRLVGLDQVAHTGTRKDGSRVAQVSVDGIDASAWGRAVSCRLAAPEATAGSQLVSWTTMQ